MNMKLMRIKNKENDQILSSIPNLHYFKIGHSVVIILILLHTVTCNRIGSVGIAIFFYFLHSPD